MSTARTIMTGGLRALGVLASGEAMDADEAAEGLEALNQLVSSWSAESLIVPADVREEFVLSAGVAAYTMGTGATFATQRPIEIKNASVKLLNTQLEAPLSIIGTDSWAPIAQKTLQAIPDRLWPQAGAPNWTLNLYPVPNAALTLVLYSQKVLDSFPDLDTTVNLLDGFERALKFGFAVEVSEEYERTPSAGLMKKATDAKATIERMNKRIRAMTVDPALLFNGYPGGYNIFKGPTG